ncbi:IS3 family transposase [Aliiglaciecola litoralis]
MKQFCARFRITIMCKALKVSRSGYYRFVGRKPSSKQCRHQRLRSHVIEHFTHFKQRYGAPRLTRSLNASNIRCSLNTVARVMQELHLRARNGKAFRYSRFSYANVGVSENILNRHFRATKPNQKWVTDITYIRVKGKWNYLATVMDLYSRAIVGWSIDDGMSEQLVTDALQMAISKRIVKPGLIVHSDRGVQYRAVKYQGLIDSIGGISSMSRRSNCWDNAVMESFFSRLKVELIYGEKYHSIQELKSSIFEYIEIFYNRVRLHSTLGYLSPLEYEARYA